MISARAGQRWKYVFVLAIGLCLLSSCGPTETAQQRHQEANTPAGKVGKVAHGVAKETEKVAAVAGKQLRKSAHEAREGWKEADRDNRSKGNK